MNRRGFLAVLAAAAADPERLLWTPGAKLISIPAAPRLSSFFADLKLGDRIHLACDDCSVAGWRPEHRRTTGIWVVTGVDTGGVRISRETLPYGIWVAAEARLNGLDVRVDDEFADGERPDAEVTDDDGAHRPIP